MAKGTKIVVSANPKGNFEECIVSGTPYPGTVMEIKAATASANGRFTYQARSLAAGSKGGIAVLREDYLQGKLAVGATTAFTPSGGQGGGNYNARGDAYVTLTRGFLYWPVAGEELNMYVTNQTGTADDVAIGDLFGVDATTGQLKANSSYTSAPFQALEAVTDPTADYIMWTKYLGNNA